MIFHPYIFAILPVFYLYSINFYEYPVAVILKPIASLVSVTLISLVLLNKTIKDKHKSATVFSIFIFFIFLFGPLYFIFCVGEEGHKILRFRYFLFIYLFVFISILFFFLKRHLDFIKISRFFNLLALAILLVMAFNTIIGLYPSLNILFKDNDCLKNISAHKNRFNPLKIHGNLPDIYFIVLDSYPDHNSLRDILNFKNENFINDLIDKGFFIIQDSHSNYNFTRFSIPATFSLDYLPMDKIGNETFRLKKEEIYLKRIQCSPVISFLRSIGYNCYIDSPLESKKYKEIEFLNSLLTMTPLVTPYIQNYISSFLFREYALSTLKSLENSLNFKSPFFVYVHIMIPHLPFMFDRFGNMPDFLNQKDVEKLFIEQLIYTNTRIKKIIDNILSMSQKGPVIIIQGDHGPDLIIKSKDKSMQIRTGILNAVYLPDKKENIFYNGMTPVNTFRILFNEYFGTNFAILPDIIYYQRDERDKLVIYKPKNIINKGIQ